MVHFEIPAGPGQQAFAAVAPDDCSPHAIGNGAFGVGAFVVGYPFVPFAEILGQTVVGVLNSDNRRCVAYKSLKVVAGCRCRTGFVRWLVDLRRCPFRCSSRRLAGLEYRLLMRSSASSEKSPKTKSTMNGPISTSICQERLSKSIQASAKQTSRRICGTPQSPR